MNNPDYFAIILSAGKGSRFESDTPKQYCNLNGKTVLEYSVQTIFHSVALKKLLVVHAQNDTTIAELPFSVPVDFTTGGKERMNSVFNGLEMIKDEAKADDFVLIHDGARPCVTKKDIKNLIDNTKNHPVGGVLATPVSNTLKKSDKNQVITHTVSRDDLWNVQTPQLLRFGLLYDALQQAITNKLVVTDDASALELQGHFPRLITGSQTNIKITYPEDLLLAELYLSLHQT